MSLEFPNKKLRALVIRDYVLAGDYDGVVCFSCGNASAALRNVGLDVIDVSPSGQLKPNQWWRPEEIHRVWPTRFDATSGHLPIHLMERIGAQYRLYLDNIKSTDESPYEVSCGSGETLICLKLAYPDREFMAIYDCSKLETTYEPEAPLNRLVEALAFDVRILHRKGTQS